MGDCRVWFFGLVGRVWIASTFPLCVVALGTLQEKGALAGVPVFGKEPDKIVEVDKDPTAAGANESVARVAQQTSTLLSLLATQEVLTSTSKSTRVWLGDGLGSIPKRVHDRMLKWEVMDMTDFWPKSASERFMADPETEKLVVLPGFEIAQPKKKPVNNIIVWTTMLFPIHCSNVKTLPRMHTRLHKPPSNSPKSIQ